MKIKRPAQLLYVPPAFRSKSKNECEENIANVRNQYSSEDTSRQFHCFGKYETLQRRSTDIVRRQVPFQSSISSNDPKNTSDESCTDEDSSDFEECCSDIVSVNDFKINKETIENHSNCHWKKEVSRESPSKTNQNENDEPDTKLLKKQLMQIEQYPDMTFSSDQGMNPEPNKNNPYRDLIYDSANSDISAIENTFDNFTKKGNLLTSSPTSDIIDEKVLDAVRYILEEDNSPKSILLFQNDSEIANNTNKNDFFLSSDQRMNLEPNKKNHYRDLFYGSADSDISDIENTFGNFTIKENLLTSSPSSDIVYERVLDAVNCISEEDNASESILLFQNYSETANNTNRKDLFLSSDQGMNSEPNKKNHYRDLFYDSADSDISHIENAFDNFKIKGNLLTSSPSSDVVDEKVLDAVKCIPEEDNATEPILLFQNDLQILNNANKKDCNYNFESYHDDSSVKKLEDFSEIFGSNYIAPPVPAPPHTLPLPPIHRLPYSVPSFSVPSRTDFPHNVQHHINPRISLPPSLQIYPDFPHGLHYRPPLCQETGSSLPYNVPHHINRLSHPRISLPPSLQIYPDFPHGLHYRPPLCQQAGSSLPFLNSPRSLQERMISPLSSQGIFDASNLASQKQDIRFYIPLPVKTQQTMNTNNHNQRYDLQNYLLSTKTMMNKAMRDSKMFP